ncbi:transcription factor grauzone-like [Anopheles nili]|uniref:transcription factor grauzone-like n=1 Tax=Anopheles nili TaxID=185578 RepID=UPI00237B5383|nr:transcription factor grauzone-like [Anopheles nili]
MKEKCRLCLEYCNSTDATLVSDDELRAKLESVFKFPVHAEDSLPEQVCRGCITTVSEFHEFSVRVQSNQELLWMLTKEKKMQPFEVVKIEAPEDENYYYGAEIDEPIDKSANDSVATGSEPTMQTVYALDIECVESNGFVEEDEEEEDDEDDDDFVPKVDPKDGTLKPPTKRRRKVTKAGRPSRNSERAPKTDKPGLDKLDMEEMAKHIEDDKRIQEFYKFDCEVCGIPLESLAYLQVHYRREHSMKGYIRCCEKLLYRRFQLLDHMAAHEGTIKCQVCQKNYKSSRYLALHMMKSHSREEDRPFKCDKCHQSFHKEHLLKAHQANHLSEKCPICEKVVSSKYALKTHVAHMHGNDGNQICDVCGKEFRTKQAMERHINEHMGVEVVQKVQCHVCQRWFHGKYNLRKHIRFMHIEGGKVFACDLCSHESPNSRALLDHKKRVHVVERFECELCGKRFKRKLYLREHIASHTGKPLYECGICDAKFNSNANCYNHRKSKHPEEWQARRQAFHEAQRKAPPSSELKKECS